MAAPPNPLGAQLRAARIRKGLSTQQVADLTEGAIAEPTVRFIENGSRDNPTLATLVCLAEALDVAIQITPAEIIVDDA